MSNASPDQNRNLKPTIAGHPTHNAYSASPSQLTLQSDMPQGQLPNSYHQYGYVQQHDPNQFQFGQPPYRAQPQLQTRHPQVAPPPHLTPQQQQQLPSPTTSRKRRISELSGDTMLPGPPGSIGAYANQSGLMGPPNDMEPSGHSNNQQQQPQQQQQHHQPQQQPQQPSQTQQQPPAPAPTGQAPSPAVKKGRTNTPWTPGEEHRLKQLRDQGSSWSEIAKNFPNRTEGSVKKHWYKDMHYADFGADEVSSFSTALLQAIKEYEANKWKVIGQKVGKPAKACEAFAKEQGWKV